jgi:hypothetical protein
MPRYDTKAGNAKATSCHSNFERKIGTQGDSDRVSKIKLNELKGKKSQAARSA